MSEITLPADEYIHYEKDGKRITVCTMRQKALHTIGWDNRPHHQPYTRHGRRFYRPYRNYFSATKRGDKDLDTLAEAGYMDRKITHQGTDSEGVLYSFNRAGLDWLGGQIGIHIYDEEDDGIWSVFQSMAKDEAWDYMDYECPKSSRLIAEELKIPRHMVLKALRKLAERGLVERCSMGCPAQVSCGEVEELVEDAHPPINGWRLTKKGRETEYFKAESAACMQSLADWANGKYDEEKENAE